MGYRSEVALVLNKEDYVFGLKWMEKQGIVNDDNLLLPENAERVIEREDKIIIYYNEVKWYNKIIWYDSLRYLYSFLYTIGEENFSTLRIGEASEDIEIEGNINTLYDTEVYPVSFIELGSCYDDKDVDVTRMNELIKEDTYYHVYCKGDNLKVGKSSWLT